MHWATAITSGLYYILFPVYLLLRLLFRILIVLISPFVYAGYLVKEIVVWPFHFLAQFEALWYFLGCAILIGIFAGLLIHGVLHLLVVVFDLNQKAKPPSVPSSIPAKGHDAVSYRAARQAKKEKEKEKEYRQAMQASLIASQPLIQQVVQEARQKSFSSQGPLSPNSGVASRSGLLQETILEHTDEEDDDSAI